MSFADASSTRLAYVVESTEGTTPSTPTFQTLRFTSESLVPNVETVVSNEIRADRNVTDQIQVGQMASGSISGELSYGTYDALFESLMSGAWSSDVLKNGLTRKSFTFEKTFETGATDTFIRLLGCLVNTFQLDISAKAITNLEFGIMGRQGESAAAIISGATYTAANDNPVLNTAADVGAITLTGISGTHIVRDLSISANANLREQAQIGSLALAGIGLGRFEVSGSLTVYLENKNILDAVLAQTSVALSLTIGRDTGEKYTIEVPSLKMSNPRIVAGGNNTDVMVEVDWQGLYDSSDACTLMITRAVS